ncbi:MAG TPA: UDP-N-acetylglucosamine 1-carboxyvinyltransferase [Solirubrobacterales bacterium]|nr:UDP-N-acetylglucosamine 1-carboxyvinyltransferase [Solirubrobacterales bacterium]HMU27757.1 UDP-N-acetylglucosamine 1-carboxyvinyltransferase [Solirubrobacterales bacterium]HMX70636.1 UDP-N-acetylglucosamine 1-carboxyvinyltransferase [Solirubrobacterales bacterium]HMY25592.1 UDP-N-acetylglucosamine 1-carboxyvinyltransferase [Solirubrobacterales bacterium]HNA24682.1 UDP-N-acetylglucosamine 1-carboxyvinyltransferase [Solirubrobacterales bacterium]
MQKFVIQGGVPLSGEITAAGNKNAALPILAACLLTEEVVTIANVPRIRDTEAQLALLESIGVEVEWVEENTVRLCAREVENKALDEDLSAAIRASFLLAGPLLARFGSVEMPPPGGDFIGRRRLDAHLDAFRDLGARVGGKRWIELQAPPSGLKAAKIFMDEPSVMGTENALMAAALTEGTTVISNAASEPHVQDLALLLDQMGAKIEGIGSNVMTVHGQKKLGGTEFRVSPDHIEIASFMALAAATGGKLRIKEVKASDLMMIRRQFRRLGLQSVIEGTDLIVPPRQELMIQPDMGGAIPKIEDGPWPAFPADLTSIAVALATKAHGEILIFEKMFENRLFFVDKLVAMGAKITLCDPHRVIISGPTDLHGERVDSPDIRAGMAMLIAALAAEGKSEIGNIRQIDRGYENIDDRLRSLGAHIERVDE